MSALKSVITYCRAKFKVAPPGLPQNRNIIHIFYRNTTPLNHKNLVCILVIIRNKNKKCNNPNLLLPIGSSTFSYWAEDPTTVNPALMTFISLF
jgi:hypothetical protein